MIRKADGSGHGLLHPFGREFNGVTEVNAADIERFFRDVEAGKTAKNEKTGPRTRIIVKGGAGAARKVFRSPALLRQIKA